jgi:LAS superfamily LD-carboxypeptidase LdcB
MLEHIKKTNISRMIATSSVLIIVFTMGFNVLKYHFLKQENIDLEKKTLAQEELINLKQKELLRVREENSVIKGLLQTAHADNDAFQNQIKNITGTVNTLEKLSKTDPELLEKYSKVFFLNENYIPEKLSNIDSNYIYFKDKPLQIHTDVWPHLDRMLSDAGVNGTPIKVISAYRSFGTQAVLKSSYKVIYGAGTANKFSADQGYSEHQLGTTVDLTTPEVGDTFVGFEKTSAYKWLLTNAYRYGFIISYPKENTYYTFEPWHFRFVGVALATKLHDQNTYFYSLDQRVIDTYLVNLFD